MTCLQRSVRRIGLGVALAAAALGLSGCYVGPAPYHAGPRYYPSYAYRPPPPPPPYYGYPRHGWW